MTDFDKDELPNAIATLFRLNNYSVRGPVLIHGAEIDLVATPIGGPFPTPIYIEATIEYVDNDKYGKDVTKLAMVGTMDPKAHRLIVSSRGFSLPVQARAAATNIETLTYDQLFAKFERFDPYVQRLLGDGPQGAELKALADVYEEPFFYDCTGKHLATEWLAGWYNAKTPLDRWLIVVGEYGTGKTALTKILQYRWLNAYKEDPSLPIPFRLELRDFTRQFDANGLIHHFLDHNSLSHIPIDFVWSLIRSGRIVLVLDGYDEMAQYLTSRERRICLQALADLSSDGVRGLMTSRPNYFSESEELDIVDILYRSIDVRSAFATSTAMDLAGEEAKLDQLLQAQFIAKFERRLQDLSEDQTEALVERMLPDDPSGAQVVIGILRKVFRTKKEEDAKESLAGKPVIISYLLQVAEQLKVLPEQPADQLTEWDVYTLVVDQLMLRDLRQAGRVGTGKRRAFLQTLAIELSQKDRSVIDDEQFRELIESEFQTELRRFAGGQRQSEIESYFEDLRRSGTLTRSLDPDRSGWRFSHNSLREFLVAERLLESLTRHEVIDGAFRVSDAMRSFASSLPADRLADGWRDLATVWPQRASNRGLGLVLQLLWDGTLSSFQGEGDPTAAALRSLSSGIAVDHVTLSRVQFSSDDKPSSLREALFSASDLEGVILKAANLLRANFNECWLETVNFDDANLTEASFVGSTLIDVSMTGCEVARADFRGAEIDSIWVETVESGIVPVRLVGNDAVGYVNFSGAYTDPVDSYSVLQFHSNFSIVEKICGKFNEQSLRQRLGIEQKGAAVRDVPFAKKFVSHLEITGLIEVQAGRSDLLSVTPLGRNAFGQFCTQRQLNEHIESFLRESP